MSSADESGTPLFELNKVSYRYPGGETGLHDIDVTLYGKERIALLGANGSGKSTMLKILDGLLFPQGGTIRAFGRLFREKDLLRDGFGYFFRREVGFVFQNSEVQLFSSSVWEEIAFGPLQLKMSDEEVHRRVGDVLHLFDLENLKSRPPFKLSGGEKKKVALACVLAVNPSVLLLDEPTAGLDPRTKRWLIDMLVQLGRAGKAVVTATHDLEIVEEIAERVLVFSEDHRLVADGSSKEILSDKDLLLSVNLIDPRFHQHAHGGGHRHYHSHD